MTCHHAGCYRPATERVASPEAYYCLEHAPDHAHNLHEYLNRKRNR